MTDPNPPGPPSDPVGHRAFEPPQPTAHRAPEPPEPAAHRASEPPQPSAPPATSGSEQVQRLGLALARATVFTPSILAETLLRELPCASVVLGEQGASPLVYLKATEQPPLHNLEIPLPGSPLRLRVGFGEITAVGELSPLLQTLAPWLALLLRRPPPPFALDPLLESVSREWNLSPAHRRVLRLVVRGFSNKEIAAELECHIKTVEAHMTALLHRSSIASRGELLGYLLGRLTAQG